MQANNLDIQIWPLQKFSIRLALLSDMTWKRKCSFWHLEPCAANIKWIPCKWVPGSGRTKITTSTLAWRKTFFFPFQWCEHSRLINCFIKQEPPNWVSLFIVEHFWTFLKGTTICATIQQRHCMVTGKDSILWFLKQLKVSPSGEHLSHLTLTLYFLNIYLYIPRCQN